MEKNMERDLESGLYRVCTYMYELKGQTVSYYYWETHVAKPVLVNHQKAILVCKLRCAIRSDHLKHGLGFRVSQP